MSAMFRHLRGDLADAGQIIVVVRVAAERLLLTEAGPELVEAAERREQHLTFAVRVEFDCVGQAALEDRVIDLVGSAERTCGDGVQPLEESSRLGRLAVEFGERDDTKLAVVCGDSGLRRERRRVLERGRPIIVHQLMEVLWRSGDRGGGKRQAGGGEGNRQAAHRKSPLFPRERNAPFSRRNPASMSIVRCSIFPMRNRYVRPMNAASAAAHPLAVAGAPVFGHPRGLFYLAFTELWERFSYYGMTALLTLYMVKQLLLPGHAENVLGLDGLRHLFEFRGPMSNLAFASLIYGWYGGLVYFTPILGGWVADRLLGAKRTVVLGALLMSAGHLAMSFDLSFLIALALLILGSGCLKGNISAQVGTLYPEAAASLRERGFTIFSTGINIGAVVGPLATVTVAEIYGWHAGFALAAGLMLLALMIYLAGQRYLPGAPATRAAVPGRAPLTPAERRRTLALVAVIILNIPVSITYPMIWSIGIVWIDSHVALGTGFGTVPGRLVQFSRFFRQHHRRRSTRRLLGRPGPPGRRARQPDQDRDRVGDHGPVDPVAGGRKPAARRRREGFCLVGDRRLSRKRPGVHVVLAGDAVDVVRACPRHDQVDLDGQRFPGFIPRHGHHGLGRQLL
jgi:MFS family permease